MKSATLLILFSFLSVTILISQNSTIKETEIDEQTYETLPGAVVMIEGTTTG
jgi:hypothetical protein